MAFNSKMRNAINDMNFFTDDNTKQKDALDALDALIVSGDSLIPFRKAVVAHKPFWNAVLADSSITIDDTDAFLSDTSTSSSSSSSPPPPQGVNDLFKAAVQKRAEFGLLRLRQEPLENLIKAKDSQEVRQLLVKYDQVTHVTKAKDWNVDSDDILSYRETEAIQLQAQKQLLLNQIDLIDNMTVELLLALLNKDSFESAAKAIHLSKDIINTITFGNLYPLIKDDILLKTFKVNPQAACQKLCTSQHFGDSPAGLEQALGFNHKPYSDMSDSSKAKAKDLVINHYLKVRIGNENETALLKAIIVARDDKALIETLSEQNKDNPPYKIGDINDLSIHRLELQETAARRLLVLALSQCTDVDALTAIQRAKNHQDVMNALDKYPTLGFAGASNAVLRQAFQRNNQADLLSGIKPAAYLSLALATKKANTFSECLNEHDTERLADALLHTHPSLEVNNKELTDYLNHSNHLKTFRQQALVAVLKDELASITDEDLFEHYDPLSKNANPDFTNNCKAFMHGADDLLDNQSFEKSLQAYIMAEAIIRVQAKVNLDNKDNYNQHAKIINDLGPNGVFIEYLQALPIPEQHHFKYRLTSQLIERCPHDKEALVIALATAKTAEDCDKALNDLGVTSTDWISKAYRDDLQKTACHVSMDDKMYQKGVLRPELLAFLSQLPLAKQQVIVNSEALLEAILDANNSAELAIILEIPRTDITSNQPLVAEYQKTRACSRIHNAEIARILADIPGLSLTNNQVHNINAILKNSERDIFGSTNAYCMTIKDIATILKPTNQKDFYNAFDMVQEAERDYYSVKRDSSIFHNIEAQHDYNRILFERINTTDAQPEKQLLNFIANLQKSEEIQQPLLEVLIDKFKNAKDKEDYISELKTEIDVTKNEHYLFLLEQITSKLTDNTFPVLNAPFQQQNFLNKHKTASLLELEEKRFKANAKRIKQVIDANPKIIAKLDELDKLNDMAWLNPEFQATAKERAHALLSDSQRLADYADVLIKQFALQKKELKRQLNDLPTSEQLRNNQDLSDKQKQAIIDFRNALFKQYSVVTSELAKYTKISQSLKGNAQKKGILQTLTDAKNSKTELVFTGISCSRQDYPLEQKKEHLSKDWKGYKSADYVDLSISAVVSPEGERLYFTDPEHTTSEPNYFTEFAVVFNKDKKDIGLFIQERGRQDGKIQTSASGKAEMTTSIKLTANKFPEDPNNKSAYTMAMAVQMLSNLTKAPTADNPLVLRGSNLEQVRYLWTALMILGAKDPNMAFDANAIKVKNLDFNAKDEYKGFKSLFSSSVSHLALHDEFDKNNSVQGALASMGALNKDKFAKSEQKNIEKVITAGSQLLKDQLETDRALDDIKQNNNTISTVHNAHLGKV